MIKISYSDVLIPTDPIITSVLIIGKLANLLKVDFEHIKCKLEPQVTVETFARALEKLQHSEACSLYLNSAMVAALPIRCSRHNTPSRCHTLTRLVQAHCSGAYQYKSIVIVCEYPEVYASGCAAARAFSIFTRKTLLSIKEIHVSVEFIVVSSVASDIEDRAISLHPEDLYALEYAAFGIGLAARIIDTPCNEMNVDEFLQEIHNVGLLLKIKPTVIRGKQLAEKGLGGIYGVGHASAVPPALAILSHTPHHATKSIAWVGKGIVFDTGGLCLKGKFEMTRMKQDCGGAAAILGAFYVAVKAEFTQNLHAVFCLAENAVGPLATRPDDIHTLFSGHTVEINNTDAEGRLVLADGVAYAKQTLNANIILDMATLTGSQIIATGKFHAALLTNNEEWENYCMQAGRTSGDLVFPIPYAPELHMYEFDSIFADMKNSLSHGNNASTSCAGLFIAYNLGFDFPGVWIHIDMAGTVHNVEKATGYGVALLSVLFGGYCRNHLLKSVSPLSVRTESVRTESVRTGSVRTGSLRDADRFSSSSSHISAE